MLSTVLYNNGPTSEAFLQRGVLSFDEACRFVQQIPYGRNRDKTNLLSVLAENTGTCGTKHALLKTLADETGISGVRLFTGIFFMDTGNTPKVAEVLNRYNVPCMPEAHCYLKYEAAVYDYTFPLPSAATMPQMVHEQEITPDQITGYKVAYQRYFMQTWLRDKNLAYTLDELWEIREACIRALS